MKTDREKFEEFAKKQGWNTNRRDVVGASGEYCHLSTQIAWMAVQNRAELAQAEIKELHTYYNKLVDDGTQEIAKLRAELAELKETMLRQSYPKYCLELHHGDLHIRQLLHDFQGQHIGKIAKEMLVKMLAHPKEKQNER